MKNVMRLLLVLILFGCNESKKSNAEFETTTAGASL